MRVSVLLPAAPDWELLIVNNRRADRNGQPQRGQRTLRFGTLREGCRGAHHAPIVRTSVRLTSGLKIRFKEQLGLIEWTGLCKRKAAEPGSSRWSGFAVLSIRSSGGRFLVFMASVRSLYWRTPCSCDALIAEGPIVWRHNREFRGWETPASRGKGKMGVEAISEFEGAHGSVRVTSNAQGASSNEFPMIGNPLPWMCRLRAQLHHSLNLSYTIPYVRKLCRLGE
jgi:hypothetical protein